MFFFEETIANAIDEANQSIGLSQPAGNRRPILL